LASFQILQNMNKIYFWLTMGLFFCFGAGAQEAFSLEDAIRYAETNHIDIKKSLLDIDDADFQVKEVLAAALPKLDGNVEYQRFLQLPTQIVPKGSFSEGDPSLGIPEFPEEDMEVRFGLKNSLSGGLSFNTLLFDGSVFVGIQASRLARELAKSQIGVTERDVRDQVTKAYLAVLIAERNREILDKNVENLEVTLHETRAMYEEGFMEKLDVDRLEYSLSNLEMELDNVENMVSTTLNVLKLQMGYPMEDSIRVTESLDQFVDRQEAVMLLSEKYDFESRPEAKPLKVAEELREMDIRQLRFGYFPTVSVFLSYNQTLQADKLNDGKWFPSSVVGGTVNIPIFDGRDRSMKIQRAKVRLEQHQLDMEQTRRAFNMEVLNARNDFLTHLNKVNNSEKSLELAEEIYHVAQVKFREGVGSSVEMYQAESSFYEAQAHYINALYDFMISKSDLEKALGKI